ncbi:hypothetical protein ACFSM7_04825 [Clavibacter michiganensis subsp. tessellarius]|uniref:hypothetical protein n=1 Tax=Clavibacter tessellarius TaxID=31965 RepID=UPI00363F77BD
MYSGRAGSPGARPVASHTVTVAASTYSPKDDSACATQMSANEREMSRGRRGPGARGSASGTGGLRSVVSSPR